MKTPSLLILLGTAGFALADDVRLADCPPAVQQAIQANVRDGKLDDIEQIKVEDRTLYVADVDLPSGRDLKIHVNGEGKLLKTVEEIVAADLPPAVTAAVEKLIAAGGRVEDTEKEVANGKATYHVEIDRPNAPDLEAVIDENGSVVSQKEEVED